MMTLGYVIVGILLGGMVLFALAFCLAIWGAVSGARPELLERDGEAREDASA